MWYLVYIPAAEGGGLLAALFLLSGLNLFLGLGDRLGVWAVIFAIFVFISAFVGMSISLHMSKKITEDWLNKWEIKTLVLRSIISLGFAVWTFFVVKNYIDNYAQFDDALEEIFGSLFIHFSIIGDLWYFFLMALIFPCFFSNIIIGLCKMLDDDYLE